jgi:hypothetical protein
VPAGTPIFRPALKNLIQVPAGTWILKHSAGRHCVPGPISALFLSFFQQRGTRHGWHAREAAGGGAKKQPLPPLFDPFTSPFLYKYNHGLHGKRVGKGREKLERNRESFQECFEQKNSLKQTLLFKVLKLLKVEKSFRFNSPFIIFGTKTWKIFALKLS